MNEIRYTIVKGSMWYSIIDIGKYFAAKGALPKDYNLDYFFRERVAKQVAKGKEQYNFNCLLAKEPFDEFANWVVIEGVIRYLFKNKNLPKIEKTHLLQAIDINNMMGIKQIYPEIYKVLKKVKL